MTIQKKIYTLLLSSILFMSLATPASVDAAEAIDPRCMTLDDCKTMRAQIGIPEAELADGFMTRADSREVTRSCPETMFGVAGGEQKEAGLCLPAQAAETKIAIGGKTTFLSLAEYIAYIYRYSMIVAGALCVMLFIVSGIQWTLSGGDGSAIDSAKERISHAITGLILMATSYVVLYTIDPNLTSLKPPEVYMVRGVGAFDPWCKNIPTPDTLLGKSRDLAQPNATPIPFASASFDKLPNTAICGIQYHISSSEGQMCKGTSCAEEVEQNNKMYTCGQKTSTSTPTCIEGNIVGRIYSSSFWQAAFEGNAADSFFITTARLLIGDGWKTPWLHDSGNGDIELKSICSDGSQHDVSTDQKPLEENPDTREMFYSISVTDTSLTSAQQQCSGPNNTHVGYLLWFDFNELEAGDIAGGTAWYTRAGSGCAIGALAGGLVGCGIGSLITLVIPLDRISSADEGHYVGKNNFEIVDVMDDGDMALSCYFKNLNPSLFLKKEDILGGIQMDIDLQKIADIDEDKDDRIAAYGSVYEQCWSTETIDGSRARYDQECLQGNQDSCRTSCAAGNQSSCANITNPTGGDNLINNTGPKW